LSLVFHSTDLRGGIIGYFFYQNKKKYLLMQAEPGNKEGFFSAVL
jgi:hypothetical protein